LSQEWYAAVYLCAGEKKERIATGDGNITAKPKKKERREDDRTQKRMVLKRLLFHDFVICLNCL
jgi:hypothetical protein